jgi:diaminopimelate decarboxylase
MTAPAADPARVAERYGTPVYVYDLAAIGRAHADLRRALPRPTDLYYSLKANPHPLVAAELAAAGCRAEVSSMGEVDAAIAAGFPPRKIMLTGPGKSEATVRHALRRGVLRFSVESPTDLARVTGLAAGQRGPARCLLRVNADQPVPGMGLTMTGAASQFGVDAAWVAADPDRFRPGGSAPAGVHLYMGTNLPDEDALMRQFEVAVPLAARLDRLLGPLAEVDLGGGFAAPYARRGPPPPLPTLARRLTTLLDEHLPHWRSGRPRVAFESGRYLVAGAGTLIGRVLDVKPSRHETFVVLDIGVHHLGGMSGLRRIPRIVPELLPGGRPDAGALPSAGGRPEAGALPSAGDPPDASAVLSNATVVGPLCTPLDTLSRGVTLPRLAVGDLVTIPNVGAYGLTASLLAFLGHPAPTEVVVDAEGVRHASRLEVGRVDCPAPAAHPASGDGSVPARSRHG